MNNEEQVLITLSDKRCSKEVFLGTTVPACGLLDYFCVKFLHEGRGSVVSYLQLCVVG